jgi:hypothetical protein
MIDAFNEKLLTITEAAAICPPVHGKKPHHVTVWRWLKFGLEGVKLEHVRVGRNVCTTEGALNTFFHALANASQVNQTSAPKQIE